MTKPIYIAIMSSLSSVINLSAHKSVLFSFGQLHTISLTMNISNRGNVSALFLEGNSIVVKTVSKRRGALPFWFWQMKKNAISWVIEEMIQVSEHVDTFVIFMEFRHALWRVWKRNGRRVGGNRKRQMLFPLPIISVTRQKYSTLNELEFYQLPFTQRLLPDIFLRKL